VQLGGATKGIEAFGKLEGKELIRLTPEQAAPFNALAAKVTETVVAEVGGDAADVIAKLKEK
jgi:hypothetical protein